MNIEIGNLNQHIYIFFQKKESKIKRPISDDPGRSMLNTSTEESMVKSEESTTSVEDVTVKVTDFVKTNEAISTSKETDREVCIDIKFSKR